MNKSNFILTGGYPLKAERLQELQTAYSIFNALGALAGNYTILEGCGLAGTLVGNGVVYINGEVIEFREADGTGTPDVIIVDEPVMKSFKNGVIKQVHTIRYATFGTAETSWPWSDFTLVDPIKNLQARILPAGTNPQMYCGAVADIPEGWQLCDGTNGTPALQGQFIVGLDLADPDHDEIGKTGGEKKVSLTAANNGPHSHGYTQHALDQEVSSSGAGIRGLNKNNTQTGTFTTGESGTGTAHENRPPYYTLAYIIYIG